MNLQPITPARADTSVQCSRCRQWFPTDAGYADLDGEAFKTFYCSRCATELMQDKYPGVEGADE